MRDARAAFRLTQPTLANVTTKLKPIAEASTNLLQHVNTHTHTHSESSSGARERASVGAESGKEAQTLRVVGQFNPVQRLRRVHYDDFTYCSVLKLDQFTMKQINKRF